MIDEQSALIKAIKPFLDNRIQLVYCPYHKQKNIQKKLNSNTIGKDMYNALISLPFN